MSQVSILLLLDLGHWLCFSIAFLEITNATVTTVVSSSSNILDVYRCEASGAPLPLNLSWSAKDLHNENVPLNGILNVTSIILLIEDNDIISELTLVRNGNFSSPVCTVSNQNGASRSEDEFEHLNPNLCELIIISSAQSLHFWYSISSSSYNHISWNYFNISWSYHTCCYQHYNSWYSHICCSFCSGNPICDYCIYTCI